MVCLLPNLLWVIVSIFGVRGASTANVPDKSFRPRRVSFVVGRSPLLQNDLMNRALLEQNGFIPGCAWRGGEQANDDDPENNTDTDALGIVGQTMKRMRDMLQTMRVGIRGTMQFLSKTIHLAGKTTARFTYWLTQNYFHWYCSFHLALRASVWWMGSSAGSALMMNPMWLSTLGFDMLSVHLLIVWLFQVEW